MALYKEIVQDDGVATNYHRILYLMETVNKQNSIAVLSYVDSTARENEKEEASRTYQRAVTYETDYDETMTIEKAYEWLKTIPEFSGALDI